MTEKIVLAYSGGLDTSVAIRWLQEQYNAEVATLTMDLGGNVDLEAARLRALEIGAIRAEVMGRTRGVRERVRLARAAGRSVVRRRLSACDGAGQAAHREASGAHRARRGRFRHSARLYGQGQRSGAFRRQRRRARALHPGRGPRSRVGHDAGRRDRLRAGSATYRSTSTSAARTRWTRTSGAAASRPGIWKTRGWSRRRKRTHGPSRPGKHPMRRTTWKSGSPRACRWASTARSLQASRSLSC